MKRFFFIGIVLILLFAAAGEMARIPFGPGNGLLPNDILVGILVAIWIIHKFLTDRKLPSSTLWAPFLLFIVIAIISLLNGSHTLTSSEAIVSSFYLIRFVEYFLLTFIAIDIAQAVQDRKKLFAILLGSATLIAVLGFFQLQLFPDFKELAEEGWDPHKNRLLSTWFDPNFVGGMLAFVLSLALGKLTTAKKLQPILVIAALILLIALFLTYSRSAYLAFMAAVSLIGLLKSRKLLVGALIAALLLISVSSYAQERVVSLYHTAQTMISDTAELPDATARLRLMSWENAIIIFQDHPWLGVGYNTYSYVQSDYGFVKELVDHSSTGSDSTLLTILATTGILGFIPYAWLLLTMLYLSFHQRKDGLALGFFAGMCGLLIHSIFVNSLLFPPLLIFLYASLGLILSPKKPLH